MATFNDAPTSEELIMQYSDPSLEQAFQQNHLQIQGANVSGFNSAFPQYQNYQHLVNDHHGQPVVQGENVSELNPAFLQYQQPAHSFNNQHGQPVAQEIPNLQWSHQSVNDEYRPVQSVFPTAQVQNIPRPNPPLSPHVQSPQTTYLHSFESIYEDGFETELSGTIFDLITSGDYFPMYPETATPEENNHEPSSNQGVMNMQTSNPSTPVDMHLENSVGPPSNQTGVTMQSLGSSNPCTPTDFNGILPSSSSPSPALSPKNTTKRVKSKVRPWKAAETEKPQVELQNCTSSASNASQVGTVTDPKIKLRILEQPAKRELRFRYESELTDNKSPGTIKGKNGKNSFPKIQLDGFQGYAEVEVYSIDAEATGPPYTPHKRVVLTVKPQRSRMNGTPASDEAQQNGHVHLFKFDNKMEVKFDNLGVLCLPKGKGNEEKINLSCIRLCFQAYIYTEKGKWMVPPVVSDEIVDKREQLKIVEMSPRKIQVDDGDTKIMLFCEKIDKNRTEVHFCPTPVPGKPIGKGNISHFHKGCGISLNPPVHYNQEITKEVQVYVFLFKRKNLKASSSGADEGEYSEKGLEFTFLPKPRNDHNHNQNNCQNQNPINCPNQNQNNCQIQKRQRERRPDDTSTSEFLGVTPRKCGIRSDEAEKSVGLAQMTSLGANRSMMTSAGAEQSMSAISNTDVANHKHKDSSSWMQKPINLLKTFGKQKNGSKLNQKKSSNKSEESQLESFSMQTQQPLMAEDDENPGLHEEVIHQINYEYPQELQSQTSERTATESQSFCLDVLKRKSSRGRRRFSSNDSKQSSASTNTISSNEQGPANSRSPGFHQGQNVLQQIEDMSISTEEEKSK